jgi:hypothetical protein
MNRAKNNKEISDAELIFKKIIMRQKMAKFNIEGWENDIVLPFLTDPDAWLGIWMLRSDEICQVLTERRLWNVAYQANKDCMEGMRPVVINDENINDENIDTYLKYPSFEPEEIPYSLRFAICRSAFVDSLNVIENSVSIKSLYSFGYEIKKPLEHGDFLPCATTDVLLAKQMNLFELEANHNRVLVNDMANEQSI